MYYGTAVYPTLTLDISLHCQFFFIIYVMTVMATTTTISIIRTIYDNDYEKGFDGDADVDADVHMNNKKHSESAYLCQAKKGH